MNMNRRTFVKQTASAAVLTVSNWPSISSAAEMKSVTASKLPRWRGFNLLEKFTKNKNGNSPYRESDFVWMAEWGFDFARLPMSYLCWTDPDDWLKIREEELK